MSQTEASTVDQYREIENSDQIVEFLSSFFGSKPNANGESLVEIFSKYSIVSLGRIGTRRRKYKKDGFTIDLDFAGRREHVPKQWQRRC